MVKRHHLTSVASGSCDPASSSESYSVQATLTVSAGLQSSAITELCSEAAALLVGIFLEPW